MDKECDTCIDRATSVGSLPCVDCDGLKHWELAPRFKVPDINSPMHLSDKEMKFDTDKVDMSLLEYFPKALEAICEVSMKGCDKYARGSFDSVPDGRRRYTAAMFRHYFQEGSQSFPKLDEELGLPHDYMTAWNALCRLELRLRGKKLGE